MSLWRMHPLILLVRGTLLWGVAAFSLWYFFAWLVALPVGWMAAHLFHFLFPDLLASSWRVGESVQIVTTVMLPHADGSQGNMVVAVDTRVYTYGLPVFAALMLAGGGCRHWGRIMASLLLLLILEACSVTLGLARQLFVLPGVGMPLLDMSRAGRQAIQFGYMCGLLILPTLVPVLLWLANSPGFLAGLLVHASLEAGEMERSDS